MHPGAGRLCVNFLWVPGTLPPTCHADAGADARAPLVGVGGCCLRRHPAAQRHQRPDVGLQPGTAASWDAKDQGQGCLSFILEFVRPGLIKSLASLAAARSSSKLAARSPRSRLFMEAAEGDGSFERSERGYRGGQGAAESSDESDASSSDDGSMGSGESGASAQATVLCKYCKYVSIGG